MWYSLRRTSIHIHVSYGLTFSNNLSASNFMYRTSPEFEFRFDLNLNLRTRNKQTNTYYDARELADGAIRDLKLVQIELSAFPKGHTFRQYLKKDILKITILLEGEHHFLAKPEIRVSGASASLFLRIRKEILG